MNTAKQVVHREAARVSRRPLMRGAHVAEAGDTAKKSTLTKIMNTDPITDAERKKYVRDVLAFHKHIEEGVDRCYSHYLQKLESTHDWLTDMLEDMCRTVQDVLEADSAEDAKKLVQAFKEAHHF